MKKIHPAAWGSMVAGLFASVGERVFEGVIGRLPWWVCLVFAGLFVVASLSPNKKEIYATTDQDDGTRSE